ncbi:MAG: S53 family peptidase [Terriglobales bacterium]|jgi:kumamolisin
MFRKSPILPIVFLAVLSLASVLCQAQAQSALTRHVREVVANGEAKLVGRLPATESLHFDIVLPLRDQAGLENFLQEVYDPTSPSFRQFLTPQEFTPRFGPSQEDWDALVAFAQASGFEIVSGSRDAMDLRLIGTVASIERAFHVTMGVYQHPTENRTFYAIDREPTTSLPFALWHISGLDNYSTPHPMFVKKSDYAKAHGILPEQVGPNATTGSGPGASFLGSDMRAAYYQGSTLTGSGQNIGLFEYYGYDIADLNTYYSNVGQTRTAAVTGISTDGTSLSCVYPSCDDTEQTLDMTQALGMAPGITTLYVYVGSTDTAIISAMTVTTDAPLSKQIGCSWGWTPADPGTLDPYFQKMASQGQNFFAASGDNSAWSSSNEAWPADDANVVSVGGTDLTTTGAAGPWKSETAWADSGGGISPDKIAIPSWQQLAGVINSSNKGSTTYRNGPDVAANANFSFYVCADQTTCTQNEYGGTSFAAPMWAGYLALANQQAAANSESIGFIDPLIYPAALGSSYATLFHDNTSGSCGTYSAVTGYDLCTGWGSPNTTGLINLLAPTGGSGSFTLSASPSSVTITQGGNGTSTITVTDVGGFAGSVTLNATGLPSGVTAAFSPNPTTSTSTLTLTASATAATGTVTVTISGTSGSLQASTTLTLTVNSSGTANFTISASPASVTITQGGNGTSTITITSQNSFSSATTLTATGLPSGVTAGFSPNPVTPPANGSVNSTLTLTASGTATTGTATITVTGTSGTLSHSTNIALTVNPSSGAQTAVYNSTLKAPGCSTVGSSCDSGPSLLLGRDHMSGGAEPNQPNTINNSCADGTSGTFHSDESNDRIVVASTSGGPLTHGTTATVSATVWAYSGYTSDALDLYYAANANSPSWVFIKTIVPTKAGAQTLSTTFTLPTGSLQAVRAQFRYLGRASSCTSGSYNDHDDLIFAVN